VAETPVVAGYEAATEKGTRKDIPLSQISVPEYALREAQIDSPEFLRMKDSMAKIGLLFNVVVKKLPTSTPENPLYGLIDGLQRFTAAKMLGWKDIPVVVVDADEAMIAELQIIANAVKVTTTPAQFSTQLRRILNSNPNLSQDELATRLSMSVGWLKDRLSLNNLSEKAATLVDDNKIQLSKAFVLAKLPKQFQDEFLEEAVDNSYPEFSGKVDARLKEIRAANRTGQKVGEREFVAVPHMRKLSEIQPIIEGENASVVDLIINQTQPATIKDAVMDTLKWVAQLDPATIEEKKKKDAQLKAEKLAKDAAKQEEQAAAKRKTAVEAVAALSGTATD